MTIRLYNTLTKTKETFVPIDPNNVRMYVCGPTVYDFAHIGNGRPAIVFDVLFCLLRHTYGAGHVTYVRNITDIDDKIIERAAERAAADKRNIPILDVLREITEQTYGVYREDVDRARPRAHLYAARHRACRPDDRDDARTSSSPATPMPPKATCSSARPQESRLRQAGAPRPRRNDRRRPRRRRALQEERHGLRAVETVGRRHAGLGQPLGLRPPRLAHRMLGDGWRVSWAILRHSWRRHRPHLPAP